MKQAKIPVDDDGVEPQVCVIEVGLNSDKYFMRFTNPVHSCALNPVHGACVCVQLGGTVGDIESMPFIEAFRQFQFKVKKENFCNIHVSLVPQVSARLRFLFSRLKAFHLLFTFISSNAQRFCPSALSISIIYALAVQHSGPSTVLGTPEHSCSPQISQSCGKRTVHQIMQIEIKSSVNVHTKHLNGGNGDHGS